MAITLQVVAFDGPSDRPAVTVGCAGSWDDRLDQVRPDPGVAVLWVGDCRDRALAVGVFLVSLP